MPHHFHKHYTLEEARSLLPQVRRWLQRLTVLRAEIREHDEKLEELVEPGRDLGGDRVNRWVRSLAELKAVLAEFYEREIQIKDLDRGLIDFPSLRQGEEVFLCWEQGEDDIEFWHELEAG
ncbi:MAG TPA: DUF2203 domain-containing protein, partial [Verrucomicrobiae bacterium]|nr:DUF2203 domain-containing protein [Verrucomicrobiae bacterium]